MKLDEILRLTLWKAILPKITTEMIMMISMMMVQIILLRMMMKVDEPESEEEMAGRLEQLRTLITDRFSST